MTTRLLFSVLAIVAGCSANPTDQQALQTQFERTVPTCHDPHECELKWAAARRWILDNAGWKLQHVSDDFMETYNPKRASSRLAARALKEPQSTGGYQIVVHLWCANTLGCDPDRWEAALDFNRKVNRAASAPTATAPVALGTAPRATPLGNVEAEERRARMLQTAEHCSDPGDAVCTLVTSQ